MCKLELRPLALDDQLERYQAKICEAQHHRTRRCACLVVPNFDHDGYWARRERLWILRQRRYIDQCIADSDFLPPPQIIERVFKS